MPLHLVLGQSAAGLLRQAKRQHGLMGEVWALDDDLSVGPLENDQTRDEWWLTVCDNESELAPRSLYAQWRALSASLESQALDDIVIWSSNASRDYVFERMAACMLKGYQGLLLILRAPARDGFEGVGFHPPETLSQLARGGVALSPIDRAQWEEEFALELRGSSGVRILTNTGMSIRPDHCLDQFLLDRCPQEWTAWLDVIGAAMTACDGQNLITDTFLSWRLRRLVKSNDVQIRGDPPSAWELKDVLVRRFHAN